MLGLTDNIDIDVLASSGSGSRGVESVRPGEAISSFAKGDLVTLADIRSNGPLSYRQTKGIGKVVKTTETRVVVRWPRGRDTSHKPEKLVKQAVPLLVGRDQPHGAN